MLRGGYKLPSTQGTRPSCRMNKGGEAKQLVEKLLRELPKLNPFEGIIEGMVWFAKFLARVK